MQTNIKEICKIAGFKITETIMKKGNKTESIFHIRKLNDEIASRDFRYLEQPLKLMQDLEAYVTKTKKHSNNIERR